MTALQDAIDVIQTAVGQVSGVKYAPADPPEKASAFPFVVTYPGRSRSDMNTYEDFKVLWDVIVELHISRKDLPRDMQTLLAYPEAVVNAIFGAMKTNIYASAGLEGSFQALRWGDIETVGWSWTIRELKILTNIT